MISNNEEKDSEVFFKFCPLMDPVKYMVGKFDLSDNFLNHLPEVWYGTNKKGIEINKEVIRLLKNCKKGKKLKKRSRFFFCFLSFSFESFLLT